MGFIVQDTASFKQTSHQGSLTQREAPEREFLSKKIFCYADIQSNDSQHNKIFSWTKILFSLGLVSFNFVHERNCSLRSHIFFFQKQI